MRCFDSEVLDLLNRECDGQPIHHIGLGAYDLQLAFAGIDRIQTMEKAVFSIGGRNFTWEDGPVDIPVWMLIEQISTSFELPTPLALRMNLSSGDFVEFYTNESKYEAAIIDFGRTVDVLVIDVY